MSNRQLPATLELFVRDDPPGQTVAKACASGEKSTAVAVIRAKKRDGSIAIACGARDACTFTLPACVCDDRNSLCANCAIGGLPRLAEDVQVSADWLIGQKLSAKVAEALIGESVTTVIEYGFCEYGACERAPFDPSKTSYPTDGICKWDQDCALGPCMPEDGNTCYYGYYGLSCAADADCDLGACVLATNPAPVSARAVDGRGTRGGSRQVFNVTLGFLQSAFYSESESLSFGPMQTGAACAALLCGNGVLDDGEECDDGNTADGDQCTSACAIPGPPTTPPPTGPPATPPPAGPPATPPPTTTTPALPPRAGCQPPSCDDGDPCTEDVCRGTICANDALPPLGIHATCAVDGAIASACGGQTIPRAVKKKLDAASAKLRRADLVGRRARRRLLAMANGFLMRAERKLGHATGVEPACVEGLRQGLAVARGRVEDLRSVK